MSTSVPSTSVPSGIFGFDKVPTNADDFWLAYKFVQYALPLVQNYNLPVEMVDNEKPTIGPLLSISVGCSAFMKRISGGVEKFPHLREEEMDAIRQLLVIISSSTSHILEEFFECTVEEKISMVFTRIVYSQIYNEDNLELIIPTTDKIAKSYREFRERNLIPSKKWIHEFTSTLETDFDVISNMISIPETTDINETSGLASVDAKFICDFFNELADVSRKWSGVKNENFS